MTHTPEKTLRVTYGKSTSGPASSDGALRRGGAESIAEQKTLPFLCRLGFHKWYNRPVLFYFYSTCKRCGKMR
jgi:hypothetical protein